MVSLQVSFLTKQNHFTSCLAAYLYLLISFHFIFISFIMGLSTSGYYGPIIVGHIWVNQHQDLRQTNISYSKKIQINNNIGTGHMLLRTTVTCSDIVHSMTWPLCRKESPYSIQCKIGRLYHGGSHGGRARHLLRDVAAQEKHVLQCIGSRRVM